MLNETRITLRGNVATDPLLKVTTEGTTLCSFRLAVTARRWSSADGKPVDAESSFYTVTCWRSLAENASASLAKGQGVVVTGRLRVRQYTHEEQLRTSADVVADGVGHDLTWGTTVLTPTRRSRAEEHRLDQDRSEADELAAEVSEAVLGPVPEHSDASAPAF